MELRRSKRLSSSPLALSKRCKTALGNNIHSVNLPLSPPSTPAKERVVDLVNESENPSKGACTPPATPRSKKAPATPKSASPEVLKSATPKSASSKRPSKSVNPKSGHANLPITPSSVTKQLPSTPGPKSATNNIYSRAKALFQRGYNDPIVKPVLNGRDSEASQLNNFLQSSIDNNVCSGLYVSGPPGTGKTAQVNLSFSHFSRTITSAKFININCMTVNKPEHIFHEIFCAVMGTQSTSYGKRKTFDDVYMLLSDKNSSHPYRQVVVLLDEMDYLITKDQQVLFQLFNVASMRQNHLFTTKLILIGISNALDLTDKFLPRLKSNGLNPNSLVFLPYTADQIKQVIMHKLKLLVDDEDKENYDANFTPIMHPVAIQLCCKKAASVTGDLRKSFDICYQAIEMVERAQQQLEGQDLAQFTWFTAPKVTIGNIAHICTNAFGGNSMSQITSLNLLQKAVLCCLFNHQIKAMSGEKSNSPFHSKRDLNVNTFYDFYAKHTVSTVDNLLNKLKKGEFLEIIGTLESSSVISLSTGGLNLGHIDIGNKLIRANVPYDDLVKGIGEVGVLKRLLHG